MKLDVSNLLKKRTDSLPFEMKFEGKALKREGFEIKINPPLTIKGEAILIGTNVNVKGTISLSMEAQCSRCLENFNYDTVIQFDEEFSKEENDEEFYVIFEEDIDLYDMVIDCIIVSVPYKFLCSDDCKGLCPTCGNNLNITGCICKNDEYDPRFAALKNLFKDDKEV